MKNLRKIAITTTVVASLVGLTILPSDSGATNWFSGTGVNCGGSQFIERPAALYSSNGIMYSVCPLVPPCMANSVCCVPR